MTQPTQAPTILREWGKCEWPGLTPAEQELMGHQGEPLWDMYAALSEQTRESIGRWVSEMAEGMAWMLSDRAPIQTHHGIAVLRNRAAYDNDGYYVAGTVGHLCTHSPQSSTVGTKAPPSPWSNTPQPLDERCKRPTS